MRYRRSRVWMAIIGVGVGATAPLAAQNGDGSHHTMSLGARIGTLGYGLEFSRMLSERFEFRVAGHYANVDVTESASDVEFDARFEFRGVSLLLDFHPWPAQGFRLTGGVVTNPVKVSGVGVPTGGFYQFNGNLYLASQVGTLTGEAEYPDVAPYLGLGFGSPRGRSKVGFVFDIGAVLAKPDFTLSATGAASNSQMASDIQAEEDDIQREIDDTLIVFPVISFGLAIRF